MNFGLFQTKRVRKREVFVLERCAKGDVRLHLIHWLTLLIIVVVLIIIIMIIIIIITITSFCVRWRTRPFCATRSGFVPSFWQLTLLANRKTREEVAIMHTVTLHRVLMTVLCLNKTTGHS